MLIQQPSSIKDRTRTCSRPKALTPDGISMVDRLEEARIKENQIEEPEHDS